MTKLEELKAAYDAATPGEWDYVVAESAETPSSFVVDEEGEHILRHRYGVTRKAQRDVVFIALAHNLMPTLLEAVELLRAVHYEHNEYDNEYWATDLFKRIEQLKEKLK